MHSPCLGMEEKYNENTLNLSPFFDASCYEGYGDDDKVFKLYYCLSVLWKNFLDQLSWLNISCFCEHCSVQNLMFHGGQGFYQSSYRCLQRLGNAWSFFTFQIQFF